MIKIKINTGNSAFDGDNEHYELSRLLHDFAGQLGAGNKPSTLKDFNGNTVGTVEYTGKDR